VVKEDTYRRGRENGKIAELIISGLREGGLKVGQYATIFDEQEAISHAMEQMQDNDLVVVLADDVAKSIDLIRRVAGDGAR
jgi:UDP-N-acetylmuramyl tripeptide synthase